MNHLGRAWLVGALVLVVGGVAAPPPASAQLLPGNPWEQRCENTGGTFSIKDLGGPKVEHQCAGVPFDQELGRICTRFPDGRTGGMFRLGVRNGTMTCTRDGVADVKVRIPGKALLGDGGTELIFRVSTSATPLGPRTRTCACLSWSLRRQGRDRKGESAGAM